MEIPPRNGCLPAIQNFQCAKTNNDPATRKLFLKNISDQERNCKNPQKSAKTRLSGASLAQDEQAARK
jgi:hypothetical protein